MPSTPDPTVLPDLAGPRGERVLVRRSARRRRTVSISRRDGDLVIAIPARFTRRQEREWARRMVAQLARKEEATSPARRTDADLMELARELSDIYFEGRAQPSSVTWSTRQQCRWGSCTATTGTIRLSSRLQGMPDWVVRSVLVHELAHLLADGHGPGFRALVARYPHTERADAFLEGVAWAQDTPMDGDGAEASGEPSGVTGSETSGR